MFGAETATLRKVNRKYLESCEMFWRRLDKISWTDRVRNEELVHRVKEKKKNILRTINKGKVTKTRC